MLSNLMVYKVKNQYLDNKDMFDNHAYNVHEPSPKEANDVEQDDLTDSEEEEEESKEMTKEEAAAKFPFF